MAKRTIVWTETAAKQRREILKYWKERNGSSKFAEKIIRLVSNQVKTIEKHPESFRETDFDNTRVSALGHFSIYYRITDDKLIIMAFGDNRQDPSKLLNLIIRK